MYGKGSGVSTVVTGGAGVALLPNTGGFRLWFIVSAVALAFGTVTLAISLIGSFNRRSNKVSK